MKPINETLFNQIRYHFEVLKSEPLQVSRLYKVNISQAWTIKKASSYKEYLLAIENSNTQKEIDTQLGARSQFDFLKELRLIRQSIEAINDKLFDIQFKNDLRK